MVTFTLLPGASLVPGFGFCLITLELDLCGPFTLPSLQSAFFSAFFAFFRVSPTTFGTTQAGPVTLMTNGLEVTF